MALSGDREAFWCLELSPDVLPDDVFKDVAEEANFFALTADTTAH